jgi:hypothetical protein
MSVWTVLCIGKYNLLEICDDGIKVEMGNRIVAVLVFSTKSSDWLWGPPSFLLIEYWGLGREAHRSLPCIA